MTVQRRNIFGPSLAQQNADYTGGTGAGGSVDDMGQPTYPTVSNNAMGETGVATADHGGMVQDHVSARARETGRDYSSAGNETGAGMAIGGSGGSSLVLGGGDGGHGDADADAPNQGSPMKTIAGSDGFRSGGGGDTGPQTGAGKTLG